MHVPIVIVALILTQAPAAPGDEVVVDTSVPGLRIAATVGGAVVGMAVGYVAATAVQALATHGVCEFALDCSPAQGWALMGTAFAVSATFPSLGAWAGDRLARGQASLGPMLLVTSLTALVGGALTATGLLLPADQRPLAQGLVQAGGALELLASPVVAVVMAEVTHQSHFRVAPSVGLVPMPGGGALATAGFAW